MGGESSTLISLVLLPVSIDEERRIGTSKSGFTATQRSVSSSTKIGVIHLVRTHEGGNEGVVQSVRHAYTGEKG